MQGRAMPTREEFNNGIWVAGNYQGGPATAPILRSSAGIPRNSDLDANGTHYSLSFNALVAPPLGGVPAPIVATAATTPYLAESGITAIDGVSSGNRINFVPPSPPPPASPRVAYLPFYQNAITSMIIPRAGDLNVNAFFTDALSGCSIFIDRVHGTGDLVVYHANRIQQLPLDAAEREEYFRITAFDDLMAEAQASMRADKDLAQAQMLGAIGFPLTEVASLHRRQYLQCIENERVRKTADGRTNFDYAAGTNVMGFHGDGGTWEFCWQTWARISYDRTYKNALFSITKHREKALRLIGRGSFYTGV